MTILSLSIIVALIVLDQISKYWAATTLAADGPIALIPNVFEFHYTENRGVAFSMLQDQRWIFIPVSLLMTVILILMLWRSPMRKSKLFSASVLLIIAGAIGNLIDRILLGYVIDFLYFSLIDFPIFNVADCFVVIGAGLLFLFVMFGMKEYEELPLRTLLFNVHKPTKESHHG